MVNCPAADRTALQRGQHAMYEELVAARAACTHLQASHEGRKGPGHDFQSRLAI